MISTAALLCLLFCNVFPPEHNHDSCDTNSVTDCLACQWEQNSVTLVPDIQTLGLFSNPNFYFLPLRTVAYQELFLTDVQARSPPVFPVA